MAYRDIDLKFKRSASLGCTMVQGLNALEQSLINIIKTAPGERIGMPDYGCSMKRMLFEKLSWVNANNIKDTIRDAIGNWEPRVTVNNVSVDIRDDLQQYDIYINYSINNIEGNFQLQVGASVQE